MLRFLRRGALRRQEVKMRQLELALEPKGKRRAQILFDASTQEQLKAGMAMMLMAVVRAKRGNGDGKHQRDK